MDILAICISFHPEVDTVHRQLQALLSQGGDFRLQALVLDNGSRAEEIAALRARLADLAGVELVELGSNLGLAAAQNRGMDIARSRGCSHVMLLDQDSLPAPDMVAQLVAAWRRLAPTQPRLAAVGPHYLDPQLDNPPDFVRLGPWGVRRQRQVEGVQEVAVDYLIASGCLIGLDAVQAVGGMREELFIDYVDIEWGLRANRLGWSMYGVWPARMQHALGDRVISLLGRRFPLHSPLRHYFVVRNALRLYRDPMLPMSWRLPHAVRLAARLAAYLLAGDARLPRLRMIGRGVVDGLRGSMGKPRWLA